MLNSSSKLKSISSILGICSFVSLLILNASCASISNLQSLLPKMIHHNIKNKAFALQINANNPIEDKFTLHEIEYNATKGYFMAIFDGHGGDELSEFANKNLYSHFMKSLQSNTSTTEESAIKTAGFDSFDYIENEYYTIALSHYLSGEGRRGTVGSCAGVAVYLNNKLYVANLGDSKARGFSTKQANSPRYLVTKLTTTFNAMNNLEQKRLKNQWPNDKNIYVCHSKKSCYVKGRGQPTRTFGDYYLKYEVFNEHIQTERNSKKYKKELREFQGPYITSSPEIKVYNIKEGDKYFIMASDGLWDYISGKQAGKIIKKVEENNNSEVVGKDISLNLLMAGLDKASKNEKMTVEEGCSLPDGRRKRRIHDDITIILGGLEKREQ